MKTVADYAEALTWCDSYDRAPTLLAAYADIHRGIPRAEWFRLAGEEWTGCDNIGLYYKQFARILRKATRIELNRMMDEAERADLAELPEVLTVYRGCYEFNRRGLSWTLSADIARDLVTRCARYSHNGHTPLLLTGRVNKASCVLKLDREEQEIISTQVRVTKTENAA